MATPQPNEGLEKAARVDVQTAVRVMQKALAAFPIESDQNKALMKALKAIQDGFGKTEEQDRQLIPAEILGMLPALGNQSPGAAAMAQKPPLGGAPAGIPS